VNDDLREIRQRYDAALPGPWRLLPLDDPRRPGAGEILPQLWAIDTDAPEFKVVGAYAARMLRANPDEAAVMAHARTDVPYLLDQLEAARAALAPLLENPGRLFERSSRYRCIFCDAWDEGDPDLNGPNFNHNEGCAVHRAAELLGR
jgi:hypothetical protein